MKLLVLLLIARASFGADWGSVQGIARDRNIEVTARNGARTRVSFVSASGDAMTVREATGERTIVRPEILRVRVFDPSRRIRSGIIWTAVGAAVGAAGGELVCVSCPNEGHGYKYVGPGLAIGASVGALGFMRSPYRTVYKSK